eukprot:2534238-Rhodomonas_salina.1
MQLQQRLTPLLAPLRPCRAEPGTSTAHVRARRIWQYLRCMGQYLRCMGQYCAACQYLRRMGGNSAREGWVRPLETVSYTHLTLPTICSV